MIKALKNLGTRVVMGIQSPSFVAEQCDSYIIMERVAPSNVDEHEDEDFLPYTGIESKKVDEMKKVRSDLQDMIDRKLNAKSEIEMGQSVLGLDDLLKKYF